MPSEFVWNDELVDEFIYFRKDLINNTECFGLTTKKMMEQFKQSKIKEKERIEVNNVWFEDDRANGGGLWAFDTTKQFHPEKLPLIKQAIESILNNEQPKEETNPTTFSYKDIPLSGELITKEECERQKRKAFYAARLGVASSSDEADILFDKATYPRFIHYQQSLK